jgi:hypothetical protein
MRTAEYITADAIDVVMGPHAGKTLPAGSHVQPIKYEYLPAHVKKEIEDRPSLEDYWMCYTHYGITPIRPAYIRRVG